MKYKTQDFKAGEVVVVTTGEYSDYIEIADVRILKDFNLSSVGFLHIAENQEQSEKHSFSSSVFLLWLQKQGYVEETANSTQEMWLGAYCSHPFEEGE